MAKADANGMNNAAGIAYGEVIRRQRKAKKMNQEEQNWLKNLEEDSFCKKRWNMENN